MVRTLSTIDGKIERLFVARSIEMAPPQNDILAATQHQSHAHDAPEVASRNSQFIVTAIQNPTIPIVWLEGNVRCGMIG